MYINSFRIYLSTVAQTFAGIKCNSEFDFHDVFTSTITHTLKLAEFIVIIPSMFELNTKTNHVAFWKPFVSFQIAQTKKYLLLKINVITNFLLFRMKYIIDKDYIFND